MSDPKITGVLGPQYERGEQAYKNKSYQYASSTHKVDHNMKPALIVYATSLDDIMTTVKHAKQQGLALAIRTGGHQYSGASSTESPNILLDLSKTFRNEDEDRNLFKVGDKRFVRTSVSWSLGMMNAWLTKNNVFVPHGQCSHVHLGGHVQTGGVGQLSRAFGLFGDHVTEIELIDYNGEPQTVSRTADPDLFWAILGGSPGNFGVVTHFTIEVHRDEDHQGAMGQKIFWSFTKEKLEELIDILCEMSDNDDMPGNFDYCLSVLSNTVSFVDFDRGFDTQMRKEFPDDYGVDGTMPWPAVIVAYVQWVPLKPGDVADDTVKKFFDRINQGSWFFGDDNEPVVVPMSQMTGKWIFQNVREYTHPYVKRAYSTNSTSLSKSGWSKWVSERIDEAVNKYEHQLFLSVQLQPFGGKHSAFRNNKDNGTSYNFRDTTFTAVLDCFYDDEYKSIAEEWTKTNDDMMLGPHGNFSTQERRLLWGSYGEFDLDSVWDKYYDSREKYEKLMAVRARADPNGTFTPNTFCVRAAGTAKKRKLANGDTNGHVNGFTNGTTNGNADGDADEEPARKRRAGAA